MPNVTSAVSTTVITKNRRHRSVGRGCEGACSCVMVLPYLSARAGRSVTDLAMARCALHRADVGLIARDNFMHKLIVTAQTVALKNPAVAIVDQNRLVKVLERE